MITKIEIHQFKMCCNSTTTVIKNKVINSKISFRRHINCFLERKRDMEREQGRKENVREWKTERRRERERERR